MSIEGLPMYRMPTTFGPSLGPRQGPDGKPFLALNDHRMRTIFVSVRSDAEALQRILPEGFTVAEPVLTVAAHQARDIEWLAGRGYNIVMTAIPVVYSSAAVREIRGNFVPVLWENMTDPIITGREDMGYPKLYADINDIDDTLRETTAQVQTSWDGFTFCDLQVSNLTEVPDPVTPEPTPVFVYKYYPATEHWGEADVAYTSMTPPEANHTRILQQWIGSGSVAFHQATWQQLPTLVTIVNVFAALPLYEVVAAGMTTSIGSVNYRHQVCLDRTTPILKHGALARVAAGS